MGLGRKGTALCAVVLGAAVFAGSAFADVLIGSGYQELKESVKSTAAKLSGEVDNFTADVSAQITADDSLIMSDKSRIKYDIENQAREEISTHFDHNDGETRESYYYEDVEQSIRKDYKTGIYRIYKRNADPDRRILKNPFEEEETEDLEKIADAFVGSLQDLVEVEESDGKKMYMGNLSASQVPPLANALVSYAAKRAFSDPESKDIPFLKDNIYVTGVSGRALENGDGILESVIGSVKISGLDENGEEHTYTIEMQVYITDIGSTAVSPPELDSAEVEIIRESASWIDEKYIGKYKNNIVIEEDGRPVKIGERFVEITSADGDSFTGRYYEVYGDEVKNEFEFSGLPDGRKKYFTRFKYTAPDGSEKTGVIDRFDQYNIQFNPDVEITDNGAGYTRNSDDKNFDSLFIRVFE